MYMYSTYHIAKAAASRQQHQIRFACNKSGGANGSLKLERRAESRPNEVEVLDVLPIIVMYMYARRATACAKRNLFIKPVHHP